MEVKKSLIIGLDLSFNSTGITISYLEDNIGKKIQFHRVVFDNNSNKTNKKYTPQKIDNVNITTYRMPTNLLVSDLVIDMLDENNFEQVESTVKALICSKKIGMIISDAILLYSPTEIIYSIENYIMPAFSGQNQLSSVSGLITLQGYVREIIIKLSLEKNISIKIYTPTPSSNKLFFTGNGKADKDIMVEYFFKYYDGNKLISNNYSVHQINDIVDSFSLMMNAFSKIIKK